METQGYIRETEYMSLRGFLKKTTGADSGTAALVACAVRRELTERQMQLAELYFVDQYTMREIGEMLGVNPSTVSRTLMVARRKLRRCLKFASKTLLDEDDEL